MEEAVAEALISGDREARILAAKGLGNLTTKQRRQLVERGVVTPMVWMLHRDDEVTVEAALSGLLSIAFGSERNKILIVKSGAISVLLKVLQRENQWLVDLVITALMILSSSSANKPTIAASGAIQILVGILYKNAINIQAKVDIISTLHNLSTCRRTIPSIVSSGAVVCLLRVICSSEKSSELVEKAMPLLEKIASSSEIALKQTGGTGGAIQALVEVMEEGSLQCKEHAAGILFLVCQSCRDRYRGLILRAGAIPGLLQLSVDGTQKTREIVQQLLLLLRECSSPGASTNKKLRNVLLEQFMGEIDRADKAGTEYLRLAEEMIAKLRT